LELEEGGAHVADRVPILGGRLFHSGDVWEVFD
jgi:hypothetical protein